MDGGHDRRFKLGTKGHKLGKLELVGIRHALTSAADEATSGSEIFERVALSTCSTAHHTTPATFVNSVSGNS
ncbi:hypothetical protein IC744_14100 [Microbacterium hominis]|uniref:hypothetical protein n=1 Tax=Microbacterium TaxID=33882 RepID=UPI00168B915A|nr:MULTISPECIES: hypothetical protein [Microbacterium]QOC24413.1 hypothetical protein IC745_08340 [Microbacterium hominis]QOC28491.1 hypothetical protein IC744_14100 [Microbacterium hominis]QYF96306.1 hypothetical protein KY498_08805 [Microbacterium sp. PAMC21962]